MKKAMVFAGLAGAAVLFSSCPQPLTEVDIRNARDTTAPVIQIDSPEDGAPFGRLIVIQGRVIDQADGEGKAGRVDRLEYEVLARSPRTKAAISPDGSFDIVFPTSLRENVVVEIRATDWNGNVGTRRLPLNWRGSDIPSFEVEAASRKVTLSWEPVPGAVSYDLFFEASALAPGESSPGRVLGVPYRENGGRLSYELANLQNGKVHSFLLVGRSADGEDNYSDVERAVPLSTLDLFPRVEPSYSHVDLSWNPIPGIGQYEVLRSGSWGGPYSNASGPIAGSSFRDGNVLPGQSYYYRVRPALYRSVDSQIAEAVPDIFPDMRNAQIGVLTTASLPVATASRGSYLYVTDFHRAFTIVSVSNPAVPVHIGTIEELRSAEDVVLAGDFAYVTYDYQHLAILDISNPASPVVLSTIRVTALQNGYAKKVVVLGNLVFVALVDDGFAVVNAADKSNPVMVYHTSPAKSAELVQVSCLDVLQRPGDRILAVGGLNKTELYTISGPDSSPTLTLQSSMPLAGRGMRLRGNILYLAENWEFHTYNLTNIAAPVLLDSLQPSTMAAPGQFSLGATEAYISLFGLGFAVVDITDPAHLALKRVFPVPGSSSHISLGSSLAYIVGGKGFGVYIYDITEAGSANLVHSLSGMTGALNLEVVRGHLYLAADENDGAWPPDWRLSVLSLADPASPTVLPKPFSYTPYRVKAAGEYAFWAANQSGIVPMSIQDPGDPGVLEPFYVELTGGDSLGIDLMGNYAVVTTKVSRLHVVDLSLEDRLIPIGSVQVPASTSEMLPDLEVRGNLAFVAAMGGGLQVVDLSDPRWPRVLDGYGDPPGAGDQVVAAAVKGDYVFAADQAKGLFVFNVSGALSWNGPQAPVKGPLGGAGAQDVIIRGGFAYVAKGAAGVEIWDVSDPRNPRSMANLATPTAALRLARYREYLYVSGQGGYLYTYKLVP